MSGLRAIRQLQSTSINTTYIYSHGATKPMTLDVPSNAIVFMQCNNQVIYADFAFDLAKLIFALTNYNVNCNSFKDYVEQLLEVFNKKGALFCCYLKECPDMDFSFDDPELNLQIYNGVERLLDVQALQIAQRVLSKALDFYKREVLSLFPDLSYQDYLKNTGFLKDVVQPNINESIDDFETFLAARELTYKIRPGNSNVARKPRTSLKSILDGLDPRVFHVVIVNTCRKGDAPSLNVSSGQSLQKQFLQYKELAATRGKHMLPTEAFLNEACNKLKEFNKQYGGKKQTKRIVRKKKIEPTKQKVAKGKPKGNTVN